MHNKIVTHFVIDVYIYNHDWLANILNEKKSSKINFNLFKTNYGQNDQKSRIYDL